MLTSKSALTERSSVLDEIQRAVQWLSTSMVHHGADEQLVVMSYFHTNARYYSTMSVLIWARAPTNGSRWCPGEARIVAGDGVTKGRR
jgi:hypothetical protein